MLRRTQAIGSRVTAAMHGPRSARHVALSVLVGVCAVLFLFDRYPRGWLFYPSCWVHGLTGLYCPGCGATRALHALLHGEFVRAFDFNALATLLAPAASAWMLILLYQALRYNRFRSPAVPGPVLASAVLAMIAFAVLRNLPMAPFSLLAP